MNNTKYNKPYVILIAPKRNNFLKRKETLMRLNLDVFKLCNVIDEQIKELNNAALTIVIQRINTFYSNDFKKRNSYTLHKTIIVA